MENKHLVVVSVDALVYEDLEYAATLPNFSRIINNGAMIKRVRTIYPSLTHPVHASIITGAPAGVTGVIRNERLHTEKSPAPWYNFLDEINCDTILHAAKRAGLTTAASTWPLTAKGGEAVDYLVPGILNIYLEGREDDVLSVYREYGATECIMDIIEEAVRRYGYRDAHPAFDEFQVYCAAEIIRRYQPNLVLVHPGYVDSARHRTGVFGGKVKTAIEETDRWLGELLSAVEDAGILDTTDFVVLSDHGQIDTVRKICPNVFLADKGFIRCDGEGNIKDYDAYIASGGLTGHVYLSRPDDRELWESVYAVLSEMASEQIYGIERVFTREEVKERYGLDGDFSFVLESDGYSGFGGEVIRPAVLPLDNSDYRTAHGNHGHMPEKGPQPPFMGMGPSFKRGAVLEEGNILNHAPTFAKILGVELRDAVGVAVTEILN
ncbi:MAG: alkaline phosphatase family protein [Clostridia bacterium]|nr:alkaline phosphatase family protein [Clostridia bacterium]